MYREDKEEGAGSSVTDQASTKIKDQSISLKTSTSLAEREVGVSGGEVGGRSGAEGRIPEQHVHGLKGREERRCVCVCVCAKGGAPVWGLGPLSLISSG